VGQGDRHAGIINSRRHTARPMDDMRKDVVAMKKWNPIWRHAAAFLIVLALVLAVAYIFHIAPSVRSESAFTSSDILWSACGMWFALVGGLVSRRYGFAIAVGALYLGLTCLAAYFLQAYMQLSILELLRVNALSTTVSVLAGMVGACAGVFIRRLRPGRRPA
jgi:uncharacterized membrane protein